jgi:hypothetical protein
MDFQRGDLLEIHWADIYEDSVGDPVKASLGKRISFGLFWAEITSLGIPCLVTTTTIDEKDTSQSGYCIYPLACILKVQCIKRARKPRRKADPTNDVRERI